MDHQQSETKTAQPHGFKEKLAAALKDAGHVAVEVAEIPLDIALTGKTGE